MKTILITGGSSGIGLGLVKTYLQQGDTVINIDKVTPKTHITGNYHFVHGDLGELDDLEKIYRRAAEHARQIDVLILNAAHQETVTLADLELEHLNRALDVNIKANVMLAKWYSEQYLGKTGRIVLISSTRAFMSEKDTIPYTVSKGALEGLKHALAVTLADKHITVNAIAPGWIHTKAESLRELDHRFHPSQRVGKVEDIAKACLYLTDAENSFVNGATLMVDGGVTIKMIYPE